MTENHTGAMIALVPSEADVGRLTVPDGEPSEQLHLTLYYLGDAASIPDNARDRVLDAVVEIAQRGGAVTGEAFAVSVFNPSGMTRVDGKDRDACVVLGIGDPSGELTALKGAVEEIFSGELMGFDLPDQHTPWAPHVTLAYTDDTDVSSYVDRTGPVVFDTLRVTFADDVYDIPLDEDDVTEEEFDDAAESGEPVEVTGELVPGWEGSIGPGSGEYDQPHVYARDVQSGAGNCVCGGGLHDELHVQAAPGVPIANDVDVEVDLDGNLIVPNVLLDVRGRTEEDFQRETTVRVPGGSHNLRNYWIRGKGAAKIRWGTEGSMKRCIRNLRKYVRDPGGLCADYHKVATGEWPRGGLIPSEGDTEQFHGDETHRDNTLYRTDRATEGESAVPQLRLAVVSEPSESGECPEGFVALADGRCVKLTSDDDESDDFAGGMPVPPSDLENDNTDEDECPPDHHRMPDGECMPDSEMESYAVESDDEDEDSYAVTPEWEGVLTVEGVESGDGRMFMPGSLTWGEPPLPLMWQKETAHGQGTNTSVRVGSITKIWREDDPTGRDDIKIIKGRGVLDLGNPDGAEVFRRMDADPPFLNTNSVDVDSIKDADVEMRYPESSAGDEDGAAEGLRALFSPPELTVFKRGRVRGTTLVEFPAFVEAKLALTEPMTEEPVVAAGEETFGATSTHKTPTADGSWDGSANERRLPTPMPPTTAARMYAYLDYAQFTSDGEVPKSAGKLPHHNVSADGSPGPANLTACSAAIAALNGARGGVKGMSAEDRQRAYAHVASHLRDAGREPPPLQAASLDTEALVAATHVMRIPDPPPREWFDEPTDVIPLGALTVTDAGRIYGYLAPLKVRHRSFPAKATTVPVGNVDYSRFMGGETIVADGGRVATGVITHDCGHATTEYSLTAGQAQEHYDNSCSIVASIRVGENRHGVWVAGALLSDVEPAQVQRIMGCRLSGDWRAHLDRPGWRELAAALLVPVPGFPMARSAPSVEMSDGQLVASSMPVRFARSSKRVAETPVVSDRVGALQARVARATQLAELRSRVAAVSENGEALHGGRSHNQDDHGNWADVPSEGVKIDNRLMRKTTVAIRDAISKVNVAHRRAIDRGDMSASRISTAAGEVRQARDSDSQSAERLLTRASQNLDDAVNLADDTVLERLVAEAQGAVSDALGVLRNERD